MNELAIYPELFLPPLSGLFDKPGGPALPPHSILVVVLAIEMTAFVLRHLCRQSAGDIGASADADEREDLSGVLWLISAGAFGYRVAAVFALLMGLWILGHSPREVQSIVGGVLFGGPANVWFPVTDPGQFLSMLTSSTLRLQATYFLNVTTTILFTMFLLAAVVTTTRGKIPSISRRWQRILARFAALPVIALFLCALAIDYVVRPLVFLFV